MRNQTPSPARNFEALRLSISANTSANVSASNGLKLCSRNLGPKSPITPTSDFVCSHLSFHHLESRMSPVRSDIAHTSSAAPTLPLYLLGSVLSSHLSTARRRGASGATCAGITSNAWLCAQVPPYTIARVQSECMRAIQGHAECSHPQIIVNRGELNIPTSHLPPLRAPCPCELNPGLASTSLC